MRRLTIIGVLMILILASVGGAAVAKGQGQGQGKGQSGESGQGQGRGKGGDKVATFNFEGAVVEVTNGSIVVNVEKGNKKARPFEGQSVPFTVTESTRVERDDQPIAVTELSVGEQVKVQSKAPRDATEFTARKISAETASSQPGS